MKPIYAADIVPCRSLRLWTSHFECPYCHLSHKRGGHKEGFVKSAMNNHVASCWEILLYQAGYVVNGYHGNRQIVVTLDELNKHPHAKKFHRLIKARIRARAKAGLTPRVP